ncbi:MAG: CYTH domain-containing protein [Candidatus Marsarchaeota archaeon]|jgi:adenylate cyclase class IV|nr:CYTH domain-containing protein [Candidatus Marsarchaeota archaeon]MCL5115080.1 CYTH domain-containing protein [Candidatus Marsarchaeota archaeon]
MKQNRKEIELKIIGIDRKEAVLRLNEIGAKKRGTHHFKRIIGYLIDRPGMQSWIRLRTDGKTTTITLKEQRGAGLNQTDEYEINVSDFKEAAMIMCRLFKELLYEETTRTEYLFEGASITIDQWPGLPLIMEIEGKDQEQVKTIYKKLKISGRPIGNISSSKVYKLYGKDISKISKHVSKGNIKRFIK